MHGTNHSREGARRACYLTPDLSDDWEGEKIKGKENKWVEKNRERKTSRRSSQDSRRKSNLVV